MNKTIFHNELLYQTTMDVVRTMLKKGIITEQDYDRINEIFIEKYHPKTGLIFTEMT